MARLACNSARLGLACNCNSARLGLASNSALLSGCPSLSCCLLSLMGVESRSNSTSELFPSSPTEYHDIRTIRPSDTDGGPFQICLVCRCCMVSSPDNCSSMSCCFGIECDLPDKPYGVCAFVPHSCNCTSCV